MARRYFAQASILPAIPPRYSFSRMPQITLTRETPLSAAEAWSRITDWPRHGAFVPLTTVHVHDRRIVARTGLGPVAFDDIMDITAWDPPHHCRLEKRGRLVQGWAEVTIEEAGATTRVTWVEELHIRSLPRLFDPLVRKSAERMFSKLLDGLLTR